MISPRTSEPQTEIGLMQKFVDLVVGKRTMEEMASVIFLAIENGASGQVRHLVCKLVEKYPECGDGDTQLEKNSPFYLIMEKATAGFNADDINPNIAEAVIEGCLDAGNTSLLIRNNAILSTESQNETNTLNSLIFGAFDRRNRLRELITIQAKFAKENMVEGFATFDESIRKVVEKDDYMLASTILDDVKAIAGENLLDREDLLNHAAERQSEKIFLHLIKLINPADIRVPSSVLLCHIAVSKRNPVILNGIAENHPLSIGEHLLDCIRNGFDDAIDYMFDTLGSEKTKTCIAIYVRENDLAHPDEQDRNMVDDFQKMQSQREARLLFRKQPEIKSIRKNQTV